MRKHDAAIDLFHALEALKLAKELTSGEVDRLIGIAYTHAKKAGDALYPEILEEMKQKRSDPLM